MKKTLSIGFLALASVFFILPTSAYAEVLYSQTVSSTQGLAGNNPRQDFGTNGMCGTQFTGKVSYVTMTYANQGNTGTSDVRAVLSTNFGGTLVPFNSATSTKINSTGTREETFFFPTPVDLSSDCTNATTAVWRLTLETTATTGTVSNSYRALNGSVADLAPNSSCTGNCDGMVDLYFVLRDDGLDNTTTRIIAQNTPVNASITPTPAVTFNYDYYFNSTTHYGILDQACVQLNDTTQSTNLIPLCLPISASGVVNFSTTGFLTPNHAYTWRPYLTASSTAVGRIYGTYIYFSTVTQPANQSVVPPTNATSSSAIQGWVGGVESTILGTPPWSYWVQMRTILNDSASLLTGTSTIPGFVFAVGATTSPIHFNISPFTVASVTRLIPSEFWVVAKALMSAVMWVLFGLMIYHEIDRRFSKHHG